MDNFRALKQSVNQLAGKPRTAPSAAKVDAAAPAAAAPAQSAVADDPTDLVPMSALANDTSDTALEAAAIRPRDPQTFELLGLKLGMSPREVYRVSKKRKIMRDGYPNLSGDFELEATKKANAALSKEVSDRSKWQWRGGYAKPANGAYMHLTTILTPTGPHLSQVVYSPKLEGQTAAELKAALIAKFGPPTLNQDNWLLWCSIPECYSVYNAKPAFEVKIGTTVAEMVLSGGSEATAAADKALEARAQAIRAKTGRKVDF